MPLSSPTSRRALKHTRTIQIEAFARDDGLWDIDARITDIKTRDITLASGKRPAGTAVHDLQLRLTIDTQFNVVGAEAASDAVPYPGHCESITADYRKLIGLNLAKGFRDGVRQRLAGTRGCTHLTELAQVLPTAAIQSFVGAVFDPQDGMRSDSPTRKPFQLDRCHALRTDGPAVAEFYPRWTSNALAVAESSES